QQRSTCAVLCEPSPNAMRHARPSDATRNFAVTIGSEAITLDGVILSTKARIEAAMLTSGLALPTSHLPLPRLKANVPPDVAAMAASLIAEPRLLKIALAFSGYEGAFALAD